ncbi:DUF317 domain-containing protein [Streptomyces sp. NPDC056254]|uniref:DUF317 domain-containing protein n=1 Tax=Streptomyces sp. NPDC056254 TaxID=3345763 RepID=UPI0035DAE836
MDTAEPHTPLEEAGWSAASHPARTTGQAPNRSAAFEYLRHATDDRWTVFGGDDANRPAWSIRLSAGVPYDLLIQLTAAAAEAALPPPAAARRVSPVPRLPRPFLNHAPGSAEPGNHGADEALPSQDLTRTATMRANKPATAEVWAPSSHLPSRSPAAWATTRARSCVRAPSFRARSSGAADASHLSRPLQRGRLQEFRYEQEPGVIRRRSSSAGEALLAAGAARCAA